MCLCIFSDGECITFTERKNPAMRYFDATLTSHAFFSSWMVFVHFHVSTSHSCWQQYIIIYLIAKGIVTLKFRFIFERRILCVIFARHFTLIVSSSDALINESLWIVIDRTLLLCAFNVWRCLPVEMSHTYIRFAVRKILFFLKWDSNYIIINYFAWKNKFSPSHWIFIIIIGEW